MPKYVVRVRIDSEIIVNAVDEESAAEYVQSYADGLDVLVHWNGVIDEQDVYEANDDDDREPIHNIADQNDAPEPPR